MKTIQRCVKERIPLPKPFVEKIEPENVSLEFTCCECGNKVCIRVDELVALSFLCDECENMENFMEVTGVIYTHPLISRQPL